MRRGLSRRLPGCSRVSRVGAGSAGEGRAFWLGRIPWWWPLSIRAFDGSGYEGGSGECQGGGEGGMLLGFQVVAAGPKVAIVGAAFVQPERARVVQPALAAGS